MREGSQWLPHIRTMRLVVAVAKHKDDKQQANAGADSGSNVR